MDTQDIQVANSAANDQCGDTASAATSTAVRFVQPRTSVIAKADSVVLEVELPGVSRECINLTVNEDELTIQADKNVSSDEQATVLLQERSSDSYRRTYVLSNELDTECISAKLDAGVLTLRIPKKPAVLPRSIAIE
jgi:HSP20 family protein